MGGVQHGGGRGARREEGQEGQEGGGGRRGGERRCGGGREEEEEAGQGRRRGEAEEEEEVKGVGARYSAREAHSRGRAPALVMDPPVSAAEIDDDVQFIISERILTQKK